MPRIELINVLSSHLSPYKALVKSGRLYFARTDLRLTSPCSAANVLQTLIFSDPYIGLLGVMLLFPSQQ